MKKLWDLLKGIVRSYTKHQATILAAAIAYFAIFSLAPTLVIIFAVTDLFGIDVDIRGESFRWIGSLIGPESARVLQQVIERASPERASLAATLISIGALLFASTTLFAILKRSLNIIWEVGPGRRRAGLVGFVLNRLLSLVLVLGIGFYFMVSLILDTALVALYRQIVLLLPGATGFLLAAGQLLLSTVVSSLLFSALFKVLPDTRLRWADVWPGGVLTTALFQIGKVAIGIYLGRSSIATLYGAAGAFIIILVWINYISLIFFAGAEFTRAYTYHYGSRRV